MFLNRQTYSYKHAPIEFILEIEGFYILDAVGEEGSIYVGKGRWVVLSVTSNGSRAPS